MGEVARKIGHFDFCNYLLKQERGTPRRALGTALNHLRQQRNAADYTLQRDFGAYDNGMRFLASGLTEAPACNCSQQIDRCSALNSA